MMKVHGTYTQKDQVVVRIVGVGLQQPARTHRVSTSGYGGGLIHRDTQPHTRKLKYTLVVY